MAVSLCRFRFLVRASSSSVNVLIGFSKMPPKKKPITAEKNGEDVSQRNLPRAAKQAVKEKSAEEVPAKKRKGKATKAEEKAEKPKKGAKAKMGTVEADSAENGTSAGDKVEEGEPSVVDQGDKPKRGAKAKAVATDENGTKPKTQRVTRVKAKANKEEGDIEEEEDEKKATSKRGKKKGIEAVTSEDPPEKKKTLQNKTTTDYTNFVSSCNKNNAKGNAANFKISSWNVDGLRALVKKNGLEYITKEDPDVLCLQEIKCSEEKLPEEVKQIEGYNMYWSCGEKEGYSGVAICSKTEPVSVKYGIGIQEFDDEGRCICVEFNDFYLVNVYVPNAGRGLVTLPKRLEWNEAFKKFVKELDKEKPVVVCGDMNVAHNEIDLANPKTNKKNAGFTPEEREGMTDFLGDGYIDTYRELYPEKTDVYTFWSYMMNARSKNVGWRLDYFIVSERLMDNICDNVVRSEVFGSDHCPITLFLNV